MASAGNIVEADHAEVAPYCPTRRSQGIQNAECDHVAETEGRRWRVIESENGPQRLDATAAVERCRHGQRGVLCDAGGIERQPVAGDTLSRDDVAVAAAEKGDAPVAERQQPLGGHACTQHIVGHDCAQPSARQPAHDLDDRHVPIGHGRRLSGVGAHGRAEDEAGRAMLAHGLHDPPLACRVLVCVGHQRDIASGLKRLFQADRQLREEGVGEVVDDHGDHIAGSATKIGGVAVIDVAETVDRVLDPTAGLALDERAVTQHQRDSRSRHAGGAG